MSEDNLIQMARDFAREQHEGQNRKGKEIPYFDHVAQVARTLSNYGFNDNIVAAGYLHDTTEDIENLTTEDIECEFNEEVARLVDGASEHDKSASWKERKQHTLNYLETQASMDEIAVKTADKIDNVRSINQELAQDEDLWDKFNAPYQDQEWYHTELLQIVETRINETPEQEINGEIHDMYAELEQEVNNVFDT